MRVPMKVKFILLVIQGLCLIPLIITHNNLWLIGAVGLLLLQLLLKGKSDK